MTINPHPIVLTRVVEQRTADLHAAAERERTLAQAQRGRERSAPVAALIVPVIVRRLNTGFAGVRGFDAGKSPAVAEAPV
jgi:hypothetical protein